MPDYQKAKIYAIMSPHTTDVYIGSTTRSLINRLAEHKYSCKRKYPFTSKKIIDLGDAYIYLIEDYPCNTKQELDIRERYYIENTIGFIVNKFIPIKTNEEKQEIKKQCDKNYQKLYREKISIKQKQKYHQNKKLKQQTSS